MRHIPRIGLPTRSIEKKVNVLLKAAFLRQYFFLLTYMFTETVA